MERKESNWSASQEGITGAQKNSQPKSWSPREDFGGERNRLSLLFTGTVGKAHEPYSTSFSSCVCQCAGHCSNGFGSQNSIGDHFYKLLRNLHPVKWNFQALVSVSVSAIHGDGEQRCRSVQWLDHGAERLRGDRKAARK